MKQQKVRRQLATAATLMMLFCAAHKGWAESTGTVVIEKIVVEKPDGSGKPIERITAGGLAFLRVEVKREPANLPVTYRWEIKGGKIEVDSEKESAALYYAPQELGVTTVTLVVLFKGEELERKSFPLEIVEVPPPPPPGGEEGIKVEKPETPSPPSRGQGPIITNPKEGESVDPIIIVEGRTRNPEEQLAVVVRPNPRDPGQSWWVQARPSILSDATWASNEVYIGAPDDPSGFPFRVCVVSPSPPRQLSRGQRLSELPPGRSFCVNVRRK